MCFSIRQKESVAKIAQKDIKCLKILRVEEGVISSPIKKGTIWTLGVVQTEPRLKRTVESNGWNGHSLNEGLHALKGKVAADKYKRDIGARNTKIYEAVIPKGAIYWENATQYCADQLKVTGVYRVKPKAVAVKKKK